jgi:hypothetical protein
MLVSESYCRIAIVLFIYVSYTNKICLYQQSPPWQDLPTRTLGLGVRNGDSTCWSQQSPPWQDIPTITFGLGVRNGDSTWWSQQSHPWQDIPTRILGLGVRNGDSTWVTTKSTLTRSTYQNFRFGCKEWWFYMSHNKVLLDKIYLP